MSDKFQMLAQLGAREFTHIDGPLKEHLYGTRALLRQWGASEQLQDAGLYPSESSKH